MGIKIKKAVKDLVDSESNNDDVYANVRRLLMNDKENAYTISGIMIQRFGVKESSINAPFKFWDKGLPSLYSTIRHCMNNLVQQNLVKKVKDGKAYHYYWIG